MSESSLRESGAAEPACSCCSSRRAVLRGALTLGAVGGLAACGGGASGASGPPAAAGTVLGAAGDVPVGGGAVFREAKVVVTQPAEGQFQAFSAVCTHEACIVVGVEDGAIRCACHGSEFSIEDGSVLSPPASSPLPARSVTVANGMITLA